MSKTQYRIIAGCVSVMSAVGFFLLQPAQMEQFSNPKLVTSIVSGVMVVLTVVSNWLPSMTGQTAGDE